MLSAIITIVILGIASGFISLTVSKSKFFESFREFFFLRAVPQGFGHVWGWLYELVSCPYCFSHWVSLAMVAIWQPQVTDCGWWLVDMGVSWFAMIAVASYAWGIFFKLTSGDE